MMATLDKNRQIVGMLNAEWDENEDPYQGKEMTAPVTMACPGKGRSE